MVSNRVAARSPRPFPYLAALALAVFCHAGVLLWLLHAYGSSRLGLSPKAIGGVAAAYLAFAFCLRLPLAACVDRVGIRALTIYALAGSALSFAAVANATSGWLLLVAAAFHGACAAAVWPCVLVGIVRVTGSPNAADVLGRMLMVEIVAAALGALVVCLLSYGGINVVVTGLMVVWIGTVFAALAGLPEDGALAPVTRALLRAEQMRDAWRYLTSPPWPPVCAVAGGIGLGMICFEALRLAVTVMELPPWQTALAALFAGASGALCAIAARRQVERASVGAIGYLAFGLALILSAGAVRLLSGNAGVAGLLAVVLAAAFGAPGCVVAFAGPVVDAGREPRGSDAPLHRLAQTFATGVGLAGGVLLAGLLWVAESPEAAINATSAAFALAALIYGMRGLLAWRTAHGSRLRS
jgi:MFS family permease